MSSSMTRRLTITMVAVVAGALVVAGLGSLLLIRAQTRRDTQRDLRRQAQGIAQLVDEVPAGNTAAAAVFRQRVLQRVLKLTDEEVIRYNASGQPLDPLPKGVSASDLDFPKLQQGETVSGVNGALAFAAAPGTTARGVPFALVLTRNVRVGAGAALWLLVAGGGALLVAGAVAANLGRRLTKPLRDAEEATRRIAAGDLATRVPTTGDDDELAALSRSINAMAESLERSKGLERQFLLSVSHDLRTPLTSIRGYAEALAERKAKPGQAAAIILSEARRLERLVGDLLELAKLDARRFSLDMRATDICEVVSDTAEGFRPAAEGAGVDLAVDVPPHTALLAAADPDRLAQVVANLVENALDFASGSITVGTARGHGAVEVWVEDDGPGIEPGDLPHVFDRFYTVSRAQRRQVASGLGLAIVHELVDAMGGSVRAEPGSRGGARLVVVLRPDAEATAA
ncbi:MAG: HAMP domain-containing histidine kinase [Acidimicrobiia bacterium]|nr:HAMP domain-containing histidine kinase [Acidimicrobiia bacterium]